MTREDQIREVERGFSELVEFAGSSWSNLAIQALVLDLQEKVRPLYSGREVPDVPLQRRARAKLPPDFQPVQVDETTHWG